MLMLVRNPDPAFHFDADPDPTFYHDVDLDPVSGSGSYYSFLSRFGIQSKALQSFR
jgi:hypothetical protein